MPESFSSPMSMCQRDASRSYKGVCIAKKDAKIYRFRLQIGGFAPLIPAFVYLSFSLGREAPSDLPVLGLVVLVFGVSSPDAISIPIQREVETCELLQRAPVSTAAIVFDESLVGSAFSIMLSLATALGAVPTQEDEYRILRCS